jgi:hypothetical protein
MRGQRPASRFVGQGIRNDARAELEHVQIEIVPHYFLSVQVLQV